VLFGVNPMAGVLLKALDIGLGEKIRGSYPVYRFRDIYLSKDGSKIILYTRAGGGNRECWDHGVTPENFDQEQFGENPCTDCPDRGSCAPSIISALRRHSLYIRDYDDEFDCTYAYFEFKTPDALDPVLDKIMEGQGGAPKDITRKFNEVIKEMQEMPKEELEKDPRFAPLVRVLKTIMKEVEK